MKLTKKQAKELSIKKWEYIVGNNGSKLDLFIKYPELHKLTFSCGYCEKYFSDTCEKCPIGFKKEDSCTAHCMYLDHPYNTWRLRPTTANAQKVLDLILKS